MIKKIIKFIKSAGAVRESDSDRDGFMSYKSESHAIGHGLYDGLTTRRPYPKELPDNVDVQREPHYFKGAFVLGTLLQAALVVGASGWYLNLW